MKQVTGEIGEMLYKHLSSQDLAEGKELGEMMKNTDSLARILISVYASWLNDKESKDHITA